MPIVQVTLSNNQISTGKRNLNKDQPSTFRLKAESLKGNTPINITESEYNRYQKAIENKKGINLTGNLVSDSTSQEPKAKGKRKSKKPETAVEPVPLLTKMTTSITRPSLIDPVEAQAVASLSSKPTSLVEPPIPETLTTNQTGKGAYTPGRSYQSGSGFPMLMKLHSPQHLRNPITTDQVGKGAYTPGRSYQAGGSNLLVQSGSGLPLKFKDNNLRRNQNFLFH